MTGTEAALNSAKEAVMKVIDSMEYRLEDNADNSLFDKLWAITTALEMLKTEIRKEPRQTKKPYSWGTVNKEGI